MEINSKKLSFEFYPPKTNQGNEKLISVAKELELLKPEYFSVTFGAGGSTQEGTFNTCLALKKQTCISPCAHISGVTSNKEEIKSILDSYEEAGFKKLVVLRGDLPSGVGGYGDFPYAKDLLEYIKSNYDNKFHIEVGAYPEIHPQAKSAEEDFIHFSNKVRAGADGAITQFFFLAEAYYKFIERCEKDNLRIPITPGLITITNKESLFRMADNCGAKIPQKIINDLELLNEEDVTKYGIDVLTKLGEDLLSNGAPGIHFYTINKLEPTKAIVESLGL
jgi:methylenetetrahydrofolate reductase (NADPH)|tara:strand:- start:1639 stop:2472 length:834 start_codon:yes stop_codon:yes gene_type:complete